MSEVNTGGSAFPTTQYANGISPSGHDHGMTLRDYLAAKAIVGQLSSGGWKCDQSHFDDVAEGAYRLADAMLKARAA